MSHQRPQVSFGLPVYNGENFLAQAIDAILAQTFEDFELIITDNASTDRTREIYLSYASQDKRIRYYRHDRNLGASKNFNRAYELSKGKYFEWAAHDDMLAPEALSACVLALEQNSDAVLSFPKGRMVDAAGNSVNSSDANGMWQKWDANKKWQAPTPQERFGAHICANHFPVEAFGLIRSAILSKTVLMGSFPAADRVMLAELSLYGPFYQVPERLFFHRTHPLRSVKAFPTLHSRAVWFDTALAGRIVFPSWRFVKECHAAMWRAPLTLKERMGCYLQMVRWVRKNRKKMYEDLAIATPQVLRRLVGCWVSREASEKI